MSNTSKNNNNKDHDVTLNNSSSSPGRVQNQQNSSSPPYNNNNVPMNGQNNYKPKNNFNQQSNIPFYPPPYQTNPRGIQPPPGQGIIIQPGGGPIPQPQPLQPNNNPNRGGGGGGKHPHQPPHHQSYQPHPIPGSNSPQQPQIPSPHKPTPQSVNNSSIPPRTLSAPPTLEEHGQPHLSHAKPPQGAFIPQKTPMAPMQFVNQYGVQPPPPQGYKRTGASGGGGGGFHPPPPQYAGEPMYVPAGYQMQANYYPPPYVMSEYYGQYPGHMQSPQPSIKTVEPPPKKVLQIIDPATNTNINTSPPKASTPTPPPASQAPPSFSLGSSYYRKQKLAQQQQEKKDEEIKKEEELKKEVELKVDSITSTTTTTIEPTIIESKVEPIIEPTTIIIEPESKVELIVESTTNKSIELGSTSTSSGSSDSEEEWEKKGDEPVHIDSTNNLILSSSGTNPFALRSSSGVIRYSHDEMWKLRPQNIDVNQDLKNIFANQIDNNGNKFGNTPIGPNKNPMNKSGNNIGFFPPQQQGGKMMAKNPPFNQKLNNSGNNYPNNNKYSMYQQQIQQQIHNQHTPQMPPHIQHQVPSVQLPVSENRWVPTKLSALSDIELQLRKTKFILNRISPEKFDVLSKDLLDLGFTRQEEVFTGVIHQIFEKAISEAKYVTMYSNLCKKLFEYEKTEKDNDRKERVEGLEKQLAAGEIKEMPTRIELEKGLKPVFRTLLLSTCQEEYEKIQKQFDTIDEIPPDLTPQERSDFEEKQFIQRKKFFGLIKFIAELFKQDMLSEKIIHTILIALMGELVKPQEIKLECFCKLLAPIGSKIVSRKDPEVENFMRGYYMRMEQLISSPNLSTRIKFLIQNVLDIKDKGWKQKQEDITSKAPKEERNAEEERKQSTGVRNTGKNNMFGGPMSFGRPMVGKPQPNQPITIQNKQPQQQPQQQFIQKSSPISTPIIMNNSGNIKKSPTITNTKKDSPNGGGSGNLWIDKIKTQMEDVLNEYLDHDDVDELVECIKEYVKSIEYYPNVVQLILSMALEQSNPKNLTNLIINLVNDITIFNLDQFLIGFTMFINTLPDVYEDRPSAFEPIGNMCYQLYNSQLISLDQFTLTLSQQVDNVGLLVTKILFDFIGRFNDNEKAAKVFSDADIKLSSFFAPTADQKLIADQFDKVNLGSFYNKVK